MAEHSSPQWAGEQLKIQIVQSNARPVSKEEWGPHKETIRLKYLDEGMTLNELMKYMHEHHGLSINPNSYKKQLEIWDFVKKSKEKDLKAMLRIVHQRQEEGKATAFELRGKPYHLSNVIRYEKRMMRKGKVWDKTDVEIPDYIRAFTPTPEPSVTLGRASNSPWSPTSAQSVTVADFIRIIFSPPDILSITPMPFDWQSTFTHANGPLPASTNGLVPVLRQFCCPTERFEDIYADIVTGVDTIIDCNDQARRIILCCYAVKIALLRYEIPWCVRLEIYSAWTYDLLNKFASMTETEADVGAYTTLAIYLATISWETVGTRHQAIHILESMVDWMRRSRKSPDSSEPDEPPGDWLVHILLQLAACYMDDGLATDTKSILESQELNIFDGLPSVPNPYWRCNLCLDKMAYERQRRDEYFRDERLTETLFPRMVFEWERRDLEVGTPWWEESDEIVYPESLQTTRDIGFRLRYCGLKHEVEKICTASTQGGARFDFLQCRHTAQQAAPASLSVQASQGSRTPSMGGSPSECGSLT